MFDIVQGKTVAWVKLEEEEVQTAVGELRKKEGVGGRGKVASATQCIVSHWGSSVFPYSRINWWTNGEQCLLLKLCSSEP